MVKRQVSNPKEHNRTDCACSTPRGGVSLLWRVCHVSTRVSMSESKRDPWARFEAWRHHPRAANIRRMFPGLGLGLAAFLALSAVEAVVTPACKLPVFLVIAEKGVGHAIDGEEGRTVCRGIVQG